MTNTGSATWRAAGGAVRACKAAWGQSRLGRHLTTPVRAHPAGRAARFLQAAGAGLGRLLDRMRDAGQAAVPGSGALALHGRVAAAVAARPLAAAGALAAGWAAGYAACLLALLRLVPAAGRLDLGGYFYVGPHGMHYPLPPAVLAGSALVGGALWLLQRRPGPAPGGQRSGAATAAAALVGLGAGALTYLLPPPALALVTGGAAGLYLAGRSARHYLLAACFALPLAGSETLLAMLGLGFGSLLAGVMMTAPGKRPGVSNPAAGPLLAFAVVVIFATVTSVTPRGSLPDLAVQLSGMALVLAMLAVTSDAAMVVKLASAAAAGLGVQALLGLYQYLARIPIDRAWVDLALQPGLAVRVVGSFGNPNVFAKYLVLLLPVAAGLLWRARGRAARWAWLGICGLGGLALVLTFSRGGWMGLAAGAVAFAVLRERRLLLLLLVGVLVIAALPAGQGLIIRRVESIFRPVDSTSAYRLVVWQETLNMIRDFWPSGVGLGHRAYMLMYPRYMLDRTKRPYHSHSTYLQVLAETGLPGLLALLWLVWRVTRTGLAALVRAGTPRRTGRGPGQDPAALAPLVAGGLAALAGAAVHGVVEPLLYIPRISIAFWLVIGLVLCGAKVMLAGDGAGGAGGPVAGAL